MWCRRRVERGIDVKSRVDVKKFCATKTDDNTERQLVHTLAHAIVKGMDLLYTVEGIFLAPFRAGPACDANGKIQIADPINSAQISNRAQIPLSDDEALNPRYAHTRTLFIR